MADPKKTAQPTKVVTGLVRFSYAHVFKPDAIEEGSEPKYSVSCLIPKEDKVTLKKIKTAIDAAKQEGIRDLWGGKTPASLKMPLRDGDDEYPGDEVMENMFFLKASSKTRPGIVDKSLQKIVSPEERAKLDNDFSGARDNISDEDFYSGCWGRASLKFFAFKKAGNVGVGCLLNNLQKIKDDVSLAGGSSAEEDFGDDFEYEEDDSGLLD